MIEVDSLSNRLKLAMKSLLVGNKNNMDYSLIIETDFEHEKHKSKLDEKDPNMNSYGDFHDTFESEACCAIQKDIEVAIIESCDKEDHCQIIFPSNLMSRISQDILRMSVAEPCGVRGCAIYIKLEEKNKPRNITTIFGNPSTPPTFEIHLTLKEDNRGWRKLQKVYLTIKSCIQRTKWTSMPKILCSAYQLEKRRLYRRISQKECLISGIEMS
ncbi:DNA damage-inducible transcript 4-like protein [Bulinus truncatus]|nr:DNA damage-inducible transcript 4-like protein [Bulinus truncatus]